jgi:hypothetical protein
MSHLTIETIARLVDETPDADEAAHLAACDACRAELDALRDDVRALATLPDMTPAPDAWDALAQRLAAEGITRTGRAASLWFRPLLQAAAAAVVFLGGLTAGRVIASSSGTSDEGVSQGSIAAEDAASQQRTDFSDAVPVTTAAPRAAGGAAVGNPSVTFASSEEPARYASPRTADEAAALLRQTEELYLSALTRYAEFATQPDAGDPVARLAALQSIVMTTQAALSQAPTDPIINGYHLTALAQRDATLRQVAAATNDRWY